MANGPPAGLDTAVVFHLGGLGGPARCMMPVMSALARGGNVETFVPARGRVADAFAALGPVTVADYSALTYARRPLEAVRLARRFAREVRGFRSAFRRRRPDLVVVVTTTLPAALLAARLERITVVVYAAEIFEQGRKSSPLLGMWGRALASATARLASAVVCCSEKVARQFPAEGGKPVTVAYPPIGEEYAGGDRARGRAMLGAEDADPCLVIVGALSRGRGQDVAVRALPLVRRRLPGARLVLVGEPHPRPVDIEFAAELRRLARDLDIAGAVVFAGATEAMADVYAAADIVLNPARVAEAFGRAAAEALVAGRPVVASRVGGVPEVIRDGVDGLLVPPDEPLALARAVCRLCESPELAGDLVRAGRERVRRVFSREESLAVWAAQLRRVAPGSGSSNGR